MHQLICCLCLWGLLFFNFSTMSTGNMYKNCVCLATILQAWNMQTMFILFRAWYCITRTALDIFSTWTYVQYTLNLRLRKTWMSLIDQFSIIQYHPIAFYENVAPWGNIIFRIQSIIICMYFNNDRYNIQYIQLMVLQRHKVHRVFVES